MVQQQTIGNPAVNPQGAGPIAFRQATLERATILASETGTISTVTQRFERTIEGSGYLYGIVLRLVAVAAGNSAAVAYNEDAPWCAYDTLGLRDVNGEMLNLGGYDAYIANLMQAQYDGIHWGGSGLTQGVNVPADTNIYNLVSSTGATGGSFTCMLRIPAGINRRDLIGILGNQDRAQKYSIRTDLSTLALIYSTAPTAAPTYTIEKYYENYAVPQPMDAFGNAQEILPPSYGTLHFITSTISESTPQGGAVVNHYLKRIGNTVRAIALIFRANGSRSTAHTNAPTNIQFKVGEDVIFNETYAYRRALMFERYGFDFPNGVLIYDAMHDFIQGAGMEIGDDYYHTQSIVNAQLIITYPSGFGSTNNSLRVITDDLQKVGAAVR